MRRALGPLWRWDAADNDEAWDRAEQLLEDSLTPEQHAAYEEHGYLEIPSGMHPGRVYRLDCWRPVAVFEHGQFAGAICLRPREHLPGPDVVLARKLLIEGAEEEFLRSGNWLSPAWRPASAGPTALLILVLLSPWLFRLPTLGIPGIVLAVLLVVAPGLLLWRRRARDASGGDEAGPA